MNKQELIKLAKQKLNATEMALFQLMLPQAGVVFLQGRPGTAKSAVLESIANKLNMVYIRMDLTTKDEVDIGLYPYLKQTDAGYSTVAHAVPDWAEMTLDNRYYLIVFEEINRAKKDIMNASLGLINERRVGHNFKFMSNVFMAAAGNMGDKDGTDVEELDIAQSSRLINYPWKMDLMDWREMYADANIHPDILKYLDHKPNAFHPELQDQPEGGQVHVCPRTWTNLSKLIVEWYGMDSTIDEYGDLLMNLGKHHVGVYAQEMYRHLNDTKRLTVKRLLAGDYKDLDKFPRENRQEVANEVRSLNLAKLTKKELGHVKNLTLSFKKTQDEDALIGLLSELLFGVHENGIKKEQNQDDFQKYMDAIRFVVYPEFEREVKVILAGKVKPATKEDAK